MAGIKHEELCIVCFLSVVIALGVVLAAPETALREESSTVVPDVMDSRRQGPPLQDLRVEGGAGSDEFGNYGNDDSKNGEDGDSDNGIVVGDGGCAHIAGEPTTDGAGHLLASGLVFLLPIYLLVNSAV